jgi:hypothetical protein
MQEIEFENVWGITAGYGDDKTIIIRETQDSDPESFNSKNWNITVILTRNPNSYITGWYVDRHELENPVESWGSVGSQTNLIYYTQDEINDGEVPDEGMVRVKVVPADEA